MTSVAAIKEYFSKDARPVTNQELMELKRALTIDEWQDIGKACAKALGQEWTTN